ncbi:EXS family-domain-containing protein [Crassisporium funariophilum]|nr:EXS family-domain-containing protein [Crassisporium funariophilum]
MPGTDNDELIHNLSFPLPYRVLLLVGVGILGWATNLHGLEALGVDARSALDLRTTASPSKTVIPIRHPPAHSHSKTVELYHFPYRIFFGYSGLCFLSWVIYRLATRGDASLVDSYGYIPVITAASILLILICPYNVLFKSEREKFTYAVRRCIFPPPNGPIYFSDVVLADIATSFAKVLGDVWLSLWMLKPGNSILIPPVEDSWLRWILPTVMSLPFFLRFRQCLIEYNVPTNESRRPLYNALKYATSFPVIFLSAAQRLVVVDLMREKGSKVAGEAWHGEHPLFRLWLLAAVVNSLYSFWWDVTNDWGLELLKFDPPQSHERQPPRPLLLPRLHSTTPLISRESSDSLSLEELHQTMRISDPPKHRHRQSCHGLRSVLFYPRAIYPALIFLNLLLRMTWSVRLSTHVHSVRAGTVVLFWLEVAELVRRWLWVFVRVEWEVIKKAQAVVPTRVDNQSGDELEYEMIPTTPESTMVR